jgi:uncharacterized protein YecT (DUF1311 family)
MPLMRQLLKPRIAFALLLGSYSFSIAALSRNTKIELPTDCSAYASVQLPAEVEKVPIPKSPPDCASYRSYRGIGRPQNYAEARACAWRERSAQMAGLGQNQKEPDAWVVGGSLILADIYFNGAGVKRNIPLALRFACESEEGMAELALRDIAKSNSSLRAHGPFEFCDYAVTTFTMNFCTGYASEIEEDRRSRYFNSLESSMTPEQKAAFERLLVAQDAYIEAHASEVDQGGTIRTMRTIGSQNILKDLFRTDVFHFESNKWPLISENQIATVDTMLQREYKKKLRELQAQTKEQIDEGAVTADGFASVEKAWESYRDAWVAFASLRYPSAFERIRAQITLDRYRLVRTIHSYS